ncbi:MFS transporter [Paraburkholderia caribensis]|uniref:MFS transporter n=1 Tax=Paraburkholderia caribensis TaxID=75105 RepID=A0ABV0DPC2_9BURK|nr:MFS transporter [Paraburkholderia caribensis]MCO4878297.1 MFS transporter [Paraburkholderia caribensis]PTB28607.1 MFS transporter [Paraburkholderia caribensis]
MENVERLHNYDIAGEKVDGARVYAKVTRRLIPLLFMCYVVAYLDRVNIGFAKLQMLQDLKFSETVYGFGAGIFFLGYFLFEVPSNIILHKVGARVWIARVMITWAIISAGTMFVTTPMMFYVLRFALGLAEAGLFPGVILYLTYWYPSARRSKITSLFYTGVPVAGIIGGPLSGWIMHSMAGVNGWAGWQWLLLIEAMPSVVMAVVVLFFLEDRVASAKWLTDEERAIIADDISRDQMKTQSHDLREGFTNPKVWFMCGIYFFFAVGLYGVGFFLPTLIKNTGTTDPVAIGWLSSLPYIAAVFALILVSRSSDARRERRWHITVPALLGAASWLVASSFSANLLVAMIALSIVTCCVVVTISQFWCMPTAILGGAAAAAGIAVINSVGNLSGFLGPFFIGWATEKTHSTASGLYMLAASLAIGGLLVLRVRKEWVNR